MATKQTEELGSYCGSLDSLEDDYSLSYADILAWSEWNVRRISMPKLIDYISSKSSIGEDYNDAIGFVGKSITIDKIKSSGKSTRGVCFPNGISLCEKDIMDSWIGRNVIEPSAYGDQVNATTEANVCYGTFSMGKVYINELWVNNLHTAESSGGSSSSEMDNATITNLTTDTITPKESCGLVHIRGGISFDSDVYGIFKFDNGTYCFDNDVKVGDNGSGSLTAELVSTNELSPKSTNYDGDFAMDMYGGFRFVNVRPNQKYLIAGSDEDEFFNVAGGTTKTYNQTEIDNKIKALEARIAALEAK